METKTTDGVLTVFAAGDMDLAQADRLWDEVSPLIAPESTVILDCSGVQFLDSVGLSTLLRLAKLARDTGAQFHLAEPSAAVLRVLELAGTRDQLCSDFGTR